MLCLVKDVAPDFPLLLALITVLVHLLSHVLGCVVVFRAFCLLVFLKNS